MNNLTKNKLLAPMNLLYKISPETDLKLLYKLKTGYTLHLDHPVTFTEKIQWIKQNDTNPLMPKCCDKFMVREYVESCDCGEILNELLWQGFDPKDIPFDDLPDEFIIKVTHGSGFNIICKDKKELNKDKTIRLLNKWLKSKYLTCYGEWFYGVEKPRVVVEKYLSNKKRNALFDYKFFCFHGEPKLIYIDTYKDAKTGVNLYDLEFNIMTDYKMGYENDLETYVGKPDNLDEMLDYARKLSQDFLHVRVDFYNVDGKIVFGELSFTESAGFCKITPHSLDVEMGSWLKLPEKEGENIGL